MLILVDWLLIFIMTHWKPTIIQQTVHYYSWYNLENIDIFPTNFHHSTSINDSNPNRCEVCVCLCVTSPDVDGGEVLC